MKAMWGRLSGPMRVTIGLGTLIATLILIEVVVARFRGPTPPQPFDQSEWATADLNKDVRRSMLHDLRGRVLRKGVSRKEVVALLGETKLQNQEHIRHLLYAFSAAHKVDVYLLFALNPSSLETFWYDEYDTEYYLAVEYDKGGKVQTTRLFEDGG